MSAYVITDLTIYDPEGIKEYQKLAPAIIAAYDGKFIVRGGQIATLEGDWKSDRIVIIEFPSVERAQEWWNSEAYAEARALRSTTAKTKMLIVEGITH